MRFSKTIGMLVFLFGSIWACAIAAGSDVGEEEHPSAPATQPAGAADDGETEGGDGLRLGGPPHPRGPGRSDRAEPFEGREGRPQAGRRHRRGPHHPGAGQGGPAGHPRRPFGGHLQPSYETLPTARKERLEEFMNRHFPEQFQELARLDQTNPEVFRHKIDRMLPRIMQLMDLEQVDPEAFELELKETRLSMQIQALARRLRMLRRDGEDSEQRDQQAEHLEQELSELVGERFEVEQELHRLQVRRLEERIEDARRLISRRQEEKDRIVERELEGLLHRPMEPPH